MLCWVSVTAGVVPGSEDAEAPLRDVLAAALEANERLARLAEELRAENARLRAENAEQAAELERVRPLLEPGDDIPAELPLASRLELMRGAVALLSARAATTWCCPNNPVAACGMSNGC